MKIRHPMSLRHSVLQVMSAVISILSSVYSHFIKDCSKTYAQVRTVISSVISEKLCVWGGFD